MKFTATFGLLAAVDLAHAALQQITGFGTNPTGVQMHISVPAKLTTNPAIIVAVRYLLITMPKFTDCSNSSTPVAALLRNGTAVLNYHPTPKALVSF